MTQEPTESWAALIEVLAEMPDVVARLLAKHVRNGGGRCRACTTGGTGQQATAWPCSINKLATRAAVVYRARPR